MKINIYYGGRGLIGDPTLFVLRKMQEVFEELNVTVERFDLYDMKTSITMLPNTLKDADGIVLATTVEWYGIGGYMQQFLDSCWLYGNKERIEEIYMCPIVMSTTYGERDGMNTLSTAWEILGGRPCSGLCGYIPELSVLECKEEYIKVIEKKAENLYRTINQKTTAFPASNHAVKQKITVTQNLDLTPQETEQLSVYASDEVYVQQQKEDIRELSGIFQSKINNREVLEDKAYIDDLKKTFVPKTGARAIYKFVITNHFQSLIIRINNATMECFYGNSEYSDVEIHIEDEVMKRIIDGEETFQKAFMSGEVTRMKGDFNLMRDLDVLFKLQDR